MIPFLNCFFSTSNMNYIEWDINPAIEIGSLKIRYYSLCFMLAFLLGLFITKRVFAREKVPVEKADTLLIYMVVSTLLGARLGHVIFYDWAYYQRNLLEIFLPFRFNNGFTFTGFSGLASHGATIGITIGLYLYSKKKLKKPLLWIVDRMTLATALGGSLVRIGNLMNSEIVGSKTDVAWAFIFKLYKDDPSGPRHPAQLYEAITYLLIFGVMSALYWKTDAAKKPGLLFGIFLSLVFSFRFIVENFKENQVAFEQGMALNMGQILSIPFVLLGLFFIVRSFRSKTYEKA